MIRAALAVVLVSAMICGCARGRSQDDLNARAMQALHDEVSRVVADVERREKLHANIDRYENELRVFQRTVLDFRKLFRSLNADPTTSRREFNDLIARYDLERKAARTRCIRVRQDLLDLTTDEEWSSIAKREIRLLRLAADPVRTGT